MTRIEITTMGSFKKYGKTTINLLKEKEPNINESVDIICAMRFWLLGEILEDRINTENFQLCSKILSHLDKVLETVYAKVRLKQFG